MCEHHHCGPAEAIFVGDGMSNDTNGVTRRRFLGRVAAAATVATAAPFGRAAMAASRAPAQGAAVAPPEVATAGRPQATDRFGASVDNIPIIDAHIHLFDGTRPQGTGYMGSAAYRPFKVSMPGLYAPLARPTGIVGAIVVESSAWVEDNLWYLEVVQADPIMVGVSGRLDPYKPEFGEYLGRYHKNPLYRAIRASRFYTNTNGKVTLDPVAVDNLKLLAQAGLAQDTANPSMPLMTANVMLADAIPNARIVMDHLPSFDPTPDGLAAYEAAIKEMAARPNIFVKLTEVYHPRLDNNQIVDEYMPLHDRLEYLYGVFGEDRVMFGTDYPNSYAVATISEEVGLMKKFFATKTRAQAEKYFWRNAARIYQYVKRVDNQPSLA
jgi:predicted TIM-barrel fold metal-dependent hydrolase